MSNIKTLYLIIMLPFLLAGLIFLSALKANLGKSVSIGMGLPLNSRIKSPGTKIIQPDYVGEKITYDVKLGKMYLGKAWFNNLANVRLDGKFLGVMTMETKLTQFKDTEKIYTDPNTLLPIRVERDIRKWLVHEKITEDYDQNNFTVTIIKKGGGRDEEKLVIKKESPIHNALLLPYYVRRLPRLDVGRIIIANLPTRRLEIKLVSIDNIKVPAGTFKAYHFKSTPKQIEIWIGIDERRIPLKIQGSGLFGYSLVMSEYDFDN